MKHKFHGVFSLLLFVLALAVALTTLWRQSVWLAFFYFVAIVLSSWGILFAYCCKCSVRLDNCSHVFPGWFTRLMPQRKQGPYSFGDIAWTVLFLAVMVLFPQYWLLQNLTAMILFWLLAIVALVEILLFVCRKCKNTGCLICPHKVIPQP